MEHIVNPIALQTVLLPGVTLDEKLAAARAVGADGVELQVSPEFYAQLPELTRGLARHGLRAAALRVGPTRLIHPEYGERERALVEMRHALAASADLNAAGVVFYGHYASHSVLPDLHPYKSPVELEAELLVTELRATLCDLAYALGANLLLAHADSSTSALLRSPQHAAVIRAKLDNHPHIFVATSTSHLDAEHIDVTQSLATPGLGYFAVTDMDGRLPGQGSRDWQMLGAAIQTSSYEGWLTIEGHSPEGLDALKAAVQVLREALAQKPPD